MTARRLQHSRPAPASTAGSESWSDRSACGGLVDFGNWPVRAQRERCNNGCPVRTQCLQLALDTIPTAKDAKDSGLVWGGMLPREVANLIEYRNVGAPAGRAF